MALILSFCKNRLTRVLYCSVIHTLFSCCKGGFGIPKAFAYLYPQTKPKPNPNISINNESLINGFNIIKKSSMDGLYQKKA
ncbi:hypothetical protein, partial [Campylobacter mucosalis]|uniref:hypothetical protein n=1 Tax=Campylobacter mucosalis TaxID=202 RepID=UPI001B8C317E